MGSTYDEICPDRPPLGSCRAVTAVIDPFEIVTWTWTSPYRVLTVEPVSVSFAVAVLEPLDGAGEAVDELLEPVEPAEPVELPVVGAADERLELAELRDVETVPPVEAMPLFEGSASGVLKLNSRTRAIAVVTRAMAPRRGNMGISV